MTRRELFRCLIGGSAAAGLAANVGDAHGANVAVWAGPFYTTQYIEHGDAIVFPNGEQTIATYTYWPGNLIAADDMSPSYHVPGGRS